MRISRCNTEILSSVLLLSLGNVGTSILAIVDTARSLPFRLLWELSDSLDCITNGQEMHEANCLLSHDFDSINRPKLAQILAKLVLGDFFWQIPKVYISGCPRLLHRKRNRGRNLRRFAPTNFDILAS